MIPLVALSTLISWWASTRGREGAHPRAQCITTDHCQPDERCVVIPNADGLASIGQCGLACESDDACPNGWTCREWFAEKEYLRPSSKTDRPEALVKACAHRSVQ